MVVLTRGTVSAAPKLRWARGQPARRRSQEGEDSTRDSVRRVDGAELRCFAAVADSRIAWRRSRGSGMLVWRSTYIWTSWLAEVQVVRGRMDMGTMVARESVGSSSFSDR